MLIAKLMSDEDLPDTYPSKNFELVQIGNHDRMEFKREFNEFLGTNYTLLVYRENGDSLAFPLVGNAYIMSESGKTISSHSRD